MNSIIRNSIGERLDFTFTSSSGAQTKKDWLVVLGHGVTGNKDRPVIADTASALNTAGLDTLAFSFAGNGASEGDFREATISKEVEDLRSILDAASKEYAKIAYVGHSMGGAVGVLLASQDPRILSLISLAGMIDTKTFAQTEFGEETPDEGLMWEEESCPLSSTFMKDLCETIRTVAPSAQKVTIPWLLLHGTSDDVVLPQDTKEVLRLKGNSVKAVFIEGADHSFSKPTHKAEMTATVSDWLLHITR